MYVGELISQELKRIGKSQVWLANQICQQLNIPSEKKLGTRSFLQQIIAGKRKLPDKWHPVVEQCLSLETGQLLSLVPKNDTGKEAAFSFKMALESMELLQVLSEENITDENLAIQLLKAQQQVDFRFSTGTWHLLLRDYRSHLLAKSQNPTA